ncbi:MAG: TRAP transporter TatT component family protein [Thermodesulfobacteriota bacterium]
MRLGLNTALVLILLGAAPALSPAADYDGIIQKADTIYAEREDPARTRAAIEEYKKAVALDPQRAEAYWRLARALYWVGGHTEDKNERLAVYKDAGQWAQKAVELAPDLAAPHYWLGISLGMYGDTKGKLESLNLVATIKKEMAEVIRIDPAFDEGGAHTVLGRLYFKVPGIFGGSNELAVLNLKKALEYGPTRPLTHLYLAEVYLEEERWPEARAHLEKALAARCSAPIAPECRMWQAQASALLGELESKKK